MNYEDLSKEELVQLLYRRDNLIKHLQAATSEIVHISEEYRELAEMNLETIQQIIDKTRTSDIELLDKDAIMNLFGCESDKALKILKLMYANRFGFKVGKIYYISKNEFIKFLEAYRGQDLKI